MGLFKDLGFTDVVQPNIDWDLFPAETFAMFESWGGKERISSATERFYYFFIDTWKEPATLCLMERGIKHAKILARIDAPQDMINQAVADQGKTMGMDKHYAIDDVLKKWLKENVVDYDNFSLVTPFANVAKKESRVTGLPDKDTPVPATLQKTILNSTPVQLKDEEITPIIKKGNFFDSRYNPNGNFDNFLVDNNDDLTITDKATNLMWQRDGYDLTSIRKMITHVKKANDSRFAGCKSWRLPTMEEALSLMEPKLNQKGIHLHQCFSAEQPFIFLAEKRDPGGYWSCDFKQGTIFWASGTIPGAFGRLCRTVE